MAEPLKNIYNNQFFTNFLKAIEEVLPNFDKLSFLAQIHDPEWSNRELKQRIRHITLVLKNHLSDNFIANTETLLQLPPILLDKGYVTDSFAFVILPDFIEVYGLEDYATSIQVFEELTQFITCEFAVRPFLLKYESAMMAQMEQWSKHPHFAVRRLASEGCRPRLPWAVAIPSFKKDPTPVLSILENLKNDESETVRRSVANNLNDVSRDHPKTVIELTKKWKGANPATDKLLKHACRTLLKQGNQEVMALFGFGSADAIKIEQFNISTSQVTIGDYLEFSFDLRNTSALPSKIRLEYGLYYQKANGTLSRKVFKISEKIYAEKSVTKISRRQSFKVITTRKLHEGLHQVAVIVNGIEFERFDFKVRLDN